MNEDNVMHDVVYRVDSNTQFNHSPAERERKQPSKNDTRIACENDFQS